MALRCVPDRCRAVHRGNDKVQHGHDQRAVAIGWTRAVQQQIFTIANNPYYAISIEFAVSHRRL
jgi:hypothetical protein